MSLTSSLIAVREHKAGEPVGYGGTWVSERDTRLGVVAMGYGDGYPRAAPSGTPVLVNGREVPIVGRVAMDMICVDLGPEAQDKSGDPVVLWGRPARRAYCRTDECECLRTYYAADVAGRHAVRGLSAVFRCCATRQPRWRDACRGYGYTARPGEGVYAASRDIP